MRNEQFLLPMFFSWKVARRGYRWIDRQDGRYLCAVDALERPDWHGAFDQYENQQPLLERTGLFHEFAELQPSEPEILGFANRFGLLTNGQKLTIEADFGPTLVSGETLQFWQAKIRALHLAVSLWDAVSVGGNRLAAELKAALVERELPLLVQRALHVTDDDPIMTALSAIQRQTDTHLREHVGLRLLFRENQPRLQLLLQPTNLLGALWLQLALAVDLRKRFVKCAECGTPFEVSRGLHTGKRPDAKFCSDRCRVGRYRGRIEQAQRLGSAGLSAKEIARKLDARVSVINGWLAAKRAKPSRRRH
jgi:hypothetical protein